MWFNVFWAIGMIVYIFGMFSEKRWKSVQHRIFPYCNLPALNDGMLKVFNRSIGNACGRVLSPLESVLGMSPIAR